MKKPQLNTWLTAIIVLLCSGSCDTNSSTNNSSSIHFDSTDASNDLFDNAPSFELPIVNIFVGGELADSGLVNFENLPLRSKLVKETLLKDGASQFVGAYRYDGYSLHDILNTFILQKHNRKQFKPMVDVYVEIENPLGEKAVFSWGEIFYPNDRHEILLATRVMRIVPVKTKEQWTLPNQSRIIVASDFHTERNLSNPVRITVKSYPKSFEVKKGLKPLYSDRLSFHNNNDWDTCIYTLPSLQLESQRTLFYGRGRGLHSTETQQGIYLKDWLNNYIPATKAKIQSGLITIVAKDGYRAVYSYSEIFNRNDQSELMLLCDPELTHNGIFRVIPSADFFSDRAVKGISEIWFTSAN